MKNVVYFLSAHFTKPGRFIVGRLRHIYMLIVVRSTFIFISLQTSLTVYHNYCWWEDITFCVTGMLHVCWFSSRKFFSRLFFFQLVSVFIFILFHLFVFFFHTVYGPHNFKFTAIIAFIANMIKVCQLEILAICVT